MKKIEKLQEKARLAERNIEDLKAEMFLAENAVIENPNNSEAALKAAGLEKQVSAAEKAFERALEAIQAEEKRLNSKEYKDAVGRLGELEKQAAEIQTAEIAKAREFFTTFEEWLAIVEEHKRMSQRHEIEAKDLYNLDAAEAGMVELKNKFDLWKGARERVEYYKRKHGV